MRRTLYWLGRDLRLDDNPALRAAADSDRLDIFHCLDSSQLRPGRYQLAAMGAGRLRFLGQGLSDLADGLNRLGHPLHLAQGDPAPLVPERIHRLGINRVVCSRAFGHDEIRVLHQVARQCPDVAFELVDSYTLFHRDQLPCPLDQWPASYTPFRHRAESHGHPAPLAAPTTLPPPMVEQFEGEAVWAELRRAERTTGDSLAAQGGEQAALKQLSHYFSGELPRHYKTVRNALAGWDNSAKLSFWLSQGSLSVRRVAQRLRQYEEQQGANDSTTWLYVELLWREYFQWLALTLGPRLFAAAGNRRARPALAFYPERFRKWCAGNTPHALVNACLRELAATGYLSNRGRQIAASALINELGIDWRYGAAWFEHHLLDYDVAVNWGNWQYIAGVGADPRGGRHFNLAKQAAEHDPDGSYARRWAPDANTEPLDSVGIDDWPLTP